MQHSIFFELHRVAIERQGPRASFVYSALNLDGGAWNELQGIVMRAYTPAVEGKGVDDVAAEIDLAEDSALTKWMRHWQNPPEWFRRTAIVVMIFLTFLTRTTSETPAPIAVTPPPIDPHVTNRRSAKKSLDTAWRASRDVYLDTLYIDVDERKRRFVHYQWAVRFQLGGESAEAIAKSAGVERSSVEQPVKQILKDLELPQRARLPTGPTPKQGITQAKK